MFGWSGSAVLEDGLVVLGVVLIIYSAYLVWLPIAFLFAGAACIIAAVLMHRS